MQQKIFHASDHDIDPKHIDRDALTVISRLKDAGHKAYLVGGSVRDLLAKATPKDFDISTSAKPEEIKAIFGRQCILIGRRFRLAHIRFGHKIIEVATFRKGSIQENELIREDNVWGSEEEDVLRRDFTINGLFYDPQEHIVIDHVGGWEDIHARTLRSIGEAEIRFKQDPVRMLRLIKFRARFRFNIHTEAKKALLKCRGDISKSSPARVLEELFRMLESGFSAPFFQLMVESKLLELILPNLTGAFLSDIGLKMFHLLIAADSMNRDHPKKLLSRSHLMACLLFPILEKEIQQKFLDHNEKPHLGQIQVLSYDIFRDYVYSAFSHFPKRISSFAAILMTNQYRLIPLSGKKHFSQKFLRSRDFSDSLLLLKIRALDNENLQPIFQEWHEQFQNLRHKEVRPPERDKRRKHSAHKTA